MFRSTRRLARCLALGVAAATIACDSSSTGPAGIGSAAGLVADVPATAPYIRGMITSVLDDRFLVETAQPNPAHPVDKAWVRLARSTRLRDRAGNVRTPADIRAGREVSVWVTGPELRSYPVQVTGDLVVLER